MSGCFCATEILKIPVEAGGGIGGFGTNSSGLKRVMLPFLVLLRSILGKSIKLPKPQSLIFQMGIVIINKQ